MKVLFLDVDGVLNTRPGSLDSDKVDLVKWIISATGCALVLSSTWRETEHQLTRIRAVLPIRDCTAVPKQRGQFWLATTRGEEIAAWAREHPEVTHFLALDDARDMDPVRAFHIATDPHIGLTPDIAARVISLFNAGFDSRALA